MRVLHDLSFSAIIAGIVAALVAFTSGAVVVFQATTALGATPEQTASWMLSLGIVMGFTSIVLSVKYKMPILTAWSTPGAALIVASASEVTIPEAVGAFMVCAALILLVGATGWFEKLMHRIPNTLGAAMLAGILLQFGIQGFGSVQSQPVLVLSMFAVYLLMRRVMPRYAIPAVLVAGVAVAWALGLLHPDGVTLQLARPVFVAPEFSLKAIIGLAVPLFLVTMASQNMPGVAIMRASGYNPPISVILVWTGLLSLIAAPWGAYSLCLVAITAAIIMGRDAHPDPEKRYIAAAAAGLAYFVVGLFGGTVASMFSVFPTELIFALAGLALMGAIGGGLTAAMEDEKHREPALVTFLVTASGLSMLGIGAAFWGLVAGIVTQAIVVRKQ